MNDLAWIILAVELFFLGGLVGDIVGYRRATLRQAREINEWAGTINKSGELPGAEFSCGLCDATLPNHLVGCPVGKQLGLSGKAR